MKNMRVLIFGALVGVLSLAGCSREKNDVVAKVGGASLTRQELEGLVPPELSRYATRESYLDLVRRWVQTRVLADEAKNRGLLKDPEVRRILDEQRDELLAQLLIQRVFDSVPDPSDADIRRYFETHQEEFLRREPEVSFMQVRLPDQPTAAALRARLTPANFSDEAARIDPDLARNPQATRLYRRGELAQGVADVLFALKEGEISAPVQDQDGWHIYHVLSRAAAGTVRPLATVQDAIVARLREEDRRRRVQNWVAELRRTRKIKVWEDRLPGQATTDTVQKRVKP
jgi:parvulin-like peptidyl-prolyl isomerase